MADNKTASGWGAEMNAGEHIGTYNAFLTGTKVAGVLLVVLLAGMAFFLL
ncbi:MAG: aa3-type cytochrome c oxidase subunit IV [Pseudomonadota bacterium]